MFYFNNIYNNCSSYACYACLVNIIILFSYFFIQQLKFPEFGVSSREARERRTTWTFHRPTSPGYTVTNNTHTHTSGQLGVLYQYNANFLDYWKKLSQESPKNLSIQKHQKSGLCFIKIISQRYVEINLVTGRS